MMIINTTVDDFRARYAPVDTYIATCVNCGHPIRFAVFADRSMVAETHWWCDSPTVSLIAHNPRWASRVSSL